MLRQLCTNRMFSLTFMLSITLFFITILGIYFKAEPLLPEPKPTSNQTNGGIQGIQAQLNLVGTDTLNFPTTTSPTTSTLSSSIESVVSVTSAIVIPQFREDGQLELSEVERPIIIHNGSTDKLSLAVVPNRQSNVTVLSLHNLSQSVALADGLDNYSYCEADQPNPNNYEPVKGSKLIGIHLLTRHGDRSPTKLLPLGRELDPWNCPSETSHLDIKNTNYLGRKVKYELSGCDGLGYCSVSPFKPFMWSGNCSTGQLTKKGTNQHKKLGKQLNLIYLQKLQFLSESDLENEVYVRSTDYQRTQQSAQALLSGMFPKATLKTKRVSMEVFPKQLETLFGNPKFCPKLAKLEKDLKESNQYKNLLKSAEPTRTLLDNVIGGPRIDDDVQLLDYYVDIFQARSCNNFPKVCTTKKKEKGKVVEQTNNQTQSIVHRDDNSTTSTSTLVSNSSTSLLASTTTSTATSVQPTNNTETSKPKPPNCVEQDLIDQIMVYANAQVRLTFRDHPLTFPILARLRIGGYLLELKRNLLLQASQHTTLPFIDLNPSHRLDDPNFALATESNHTKFSVKKLTYHSAHDTTLALVLGALHSDEMRWPPYASNLLVELWLDEHNRNSEFANDDDANPNPKESDGLDQFQVRFLYNGSPLTLPWCKSGLCKLHSFLDYLEKSLGLIQGYETYLFENLNGKREDTSSTSGLSDGDVEKNNATMQADLNPGLLQKKQLKKWRYLDECWLD